LEPVSAADDPFQVSNTIFYVDVTTSGSGSSLLEMYVTNVSDTSRTINVSLWNHYITPDSDTQWADPSWVTSINPASVELAPNEKAVFNIALSIPAGINDGKYITWLKVSDIVKLDKPITIMIRKGSAVPTYDYSITPSSYRLVVTGKTASVTVDDPSDTSAPPLMVKSKSSGITMFKAALEEYKDVTISEDSSVSHSSSDIGKTFKALTNEEISGWFIPYAEVDGQGNPRDIMANPLKLKPYASGYINWSLEIPDSVKDGNYCVAIRVAPAENVTSNVKIEYLSILLITVDRGGGFNIMSFVKIIGMIIGISIAAICILMLIRKLRSRRE
jgi:hypothetical protein